MTWLLIGLVSGALLLGLGLGLVLLGGAALAAEDRRRLVARMRTDA